MAAERKWVERRKMGTVRGREGKKESKRERKRKGRKKEKTEGGRRGVVGGGRDKVDVV